MGGIRRWVLTAQSAPDQGLGPDHAVVAASAIFGSSGVLRMTVSVVVDSALRPAPKLAPLRRTVAAAVGLQPKRGDKLTITRMPFAPATSARAGATGVSVLGITDAGRYLASVLGAAVALILLAGLGLELARRKP